MAWRGLMSWRGRLQGSRRTLRTTGLLRVFDILNPDSHGAFDVLEPTD